MGWSSGYSLLFEVWEAVESYIPDDKKVDVVEKIINGFLNLDMDEFDDFVNQYPYAKEAYLRIFPELAEFF